MPIKTPTNAAFLKLAARNFSATVYDTDDLSTIRGSSLILLEVPLLVLDRLKQRTDTEVTVLQAAASELVVALRTVDSAHTNLTISAARMNRPKPVKKQKWNKEIHAGVTRLKTGEITDEALEKAAATVCETFGIDQEKQPAMAAHLLQLCGNAGEAAQAGATIPTQERCDEIADDIRDFLQSPQRGLPLDLFCFGVSVQRQTRGQNYGEMLDALNADLSRQQYQSPSLPMPAQSRLGSDNNAVCQLTNLLAAEPGKTKSGKPVSASVFRRRKIGIDGKNRFYTRVLQAGLKDLPDGSEAADKERIEAALDLFQTTFSGSFANDFHDIVASRIKGISKSAAANISVITIDGNGFGAHRSAITAEHGACGLQEFSDYLEARKALLLADILCWIDRNKAEMVLDGTIRFETLLWGGDEFCFVLPSWAGWSFVAQLQKSLADWKLPHTDKQLHFATGMVFAKAKAPIRASREASDNLCNMAKHDRSKSLVQVAAYESVDSIAMNPGQFRNSLFGAELKDDLFSIPINGFADTIERTENVFAAIGRSGLTKWLEDNRENIAGISTDADRLVKDIVQSLRDLDARIGSGSALAHVNNAEGIIWLVQQILLKDYIRGGGVQ